MHSSSPDIFALPISDRLDMAATLRDPNRVVEPLPGGLTNANFKVTTSAGIFVARLSGPSAGLLAIDREAEYQNSVIAAASGVAPKVVDYVPAAGVLVIQWLDGRTLGAADLASEAVLLRVANACRKLHSGRAFSSEFDMFDIAGRYLSTIAERGFRLPDRYLEFMSAWNQVRTVLAMSAPVPVPCHNDLLAANFIDDGASLWLIDYEYSGNNDPCFELGNIWSESNLADDQLGLLVDSYYGEHRPAMIARARLQALVSQYGWTLWGVIQNAISELDFDFWDWSMEKYERAVATFDSPAFNKLLTATAAGRTVSPIPTSAGVPPGDQSRSHHQEGETL